MAPWGSGDLRLGRPFGWTTKKAGLFRVWDYCSLVSSSWFEATVGMVSAIGSMAAAVAAWCGQPVWRCELRARGHEPNGNEMLGPKPRRVSHQDR